MKVKQLHRVGRLVVAMAAGWMLMDGRAASSAPAKAGQPAPLLELAHVKARSGQAPDYPKCAIVTNGNSRAKLEAESDIHQASAAIADALQENQEKRNAVALGTEPMANRWKLNYGLEHVWTTHFTPDLAERHYTTPLVHMFAHGKLMFDLSNHDKDTGEALFGLRLTFPFGS